MMCNMPMLIVLWMIHHFDMDQNIDVDVDAHAHDVQHADCEMTGHLSMDWHHRGCSSLMCAPFGTSYDLTNYEIRHILKNIIIIFIFILKPREVNDNHMNLFLFQPSAHQYQLPRPPNKKKKKKKEREKDFPRRYDVNFFLVPLISSGQVRNVRFVKIFLPVFPHGYATLITDKCDNNNHLLMVNG